MNIDTHVHKFTCISLCTYVYIHNHTHIYHQLVFSALGSLCEIFLFWFFKTHEKISSSKIIYILNTQYWNTEK